MTSFSRWFFARLMNMLGLGSTVAVRDDRLICWIDLRSAVSHINMAEGADPSLVEKFVSITGASECRAQALLSACNGNLEMAIGMHLEEENDEPAGNGQLESVNDTNMGEPSVRAPIPQKRGVLLEGPYRASRPRRRGNQSVFDAFRDFQAEAREQELELSGQAMRSKRKTLQDLFKPPLDIMHKGTFDTAKVAGEQEGKWLLVNIQDSKEFSCQQLNRDVWSNDAVRSIIAEHFILWQVYHDSDDGDRYIQFYHVSKFPHLALLDPRTGEKLVDWDGIDAQSFCENATEFLSNHSLGKSTNCLSPPAKRRKRESIIDASEDSQLEAAIAASLKEISATSNPGNNNFDNPVEDAGEDDSLTEFSGSESDSEEITKTVSKNSKNTSGSNPSNDDVDKKEQETNSSEMNDNGMKGCSTNNEQRADDVETLKEERCEEESEDDDADSGCVKACLMLRYPNGTRKQKAFPAEATILDLVKYVQTQGFSNERYELVTNFPRKNLSYLNSDLSLKDAGLFPRETVFIQERR